MKWVYYIECNQNSPLNLLKEREEIPRFKIEGMPEKSLGGKEKIEEDPLSQGSKGRLRNSEKLNSSAVAIFNGFH